MIPLFIWQINENGLSRLISFVFLQKMNKPIEFFIFHLF
ncbi:hypothetical protein BSM4216_3088 [Bacillus smithii]|nr:hypothetical protein BSM4216_3088 [Bacillus smithii]